MNTNFIACPLQWIKIFVMTSNLNCVAQPGTPATWLSGMTSATTDFADEIPATQRSQGEDWFVMNGCFKSVLLKFIF